MNQLRLREIAVDDTNEKVCDCIGRAPKAITINSYDGLFSFGLNYAEVKALMSWLVERNIEEEEKLKKMMEVK